MFGFNSNKNNEEAKVVADDGYNGRRRTIEISIAETFGTCDPQKIDKIWREFMPEVTNAILDTKDYAEANNKNALAMQKDLLYKLDALEKQNEEIMKQNEEAQRRNKELQEKYNALVERMAGYIERENGKGR